MVTLAAGLGSEVAQPLLKWAGGKRKLLPQLQARLPEGIGPDACHRLVEPFVGGGSMFFYLRPTSALLSDANAELINLYTTVRDDVKGLISALDELDLADYGPDAYYEVRAMRPVHSVEQAARMVFLNKWGWNGLYRVNRRGEFNVPFGSSSSAKRPRLYDAGNLFAVAELLKRAELAVASYTESLDRVERGDFVYLDPPYHPLSPTSSFTAYTKASFALDDQQELRDRMAAFGHASDSGVSVMQSNSVAPELVALYENEPTMRLSYVSAGRAISAKASSRGMQRELVITNYN